MIARAAGLLGTGVCEKNDRPEIRRQGVFWGLEHWILRHFSRGVRIWGQKWPKLTKKLQYSKQAKVWKHYKFTICLTSIFLKRSQELTRLILTRVANSLAGNFRWKQGRDKTRSDRAHKETRHEAAQGQRGQPTPLQAPVGFGSGAGSPGLRRRIASNAKGIGAFRRAGPPE